MKLNVLICTYDEGILRVPDVLITSREDVSYVISMQYSDEKYLQEIPSELSERHDVRVVTLAGRGLSRNRNHALMAADGDIALIADDDGRYRDEYFDNILTTFHDNPQVDIAQFMIHGPQGAWNKPYATHPHPYAKRPKGMFPASVELAMRLSTVKTQVRFNEFFGLGAPVLGAGEEDVLLHDTMQRGLNVWFFPLFVVDMPYGSTGDRVYTDRRVMMAQGAVNYHIYGAMAWLRMIKFSLVGACKRRGKLLDLLSGTFAGINYYKKHIAHENSIGRRSK